MTKDKRDMELGALRLMLDERRKEIDRIEKEIDTLLLDGRKESLKVGDIYEGNIDDTVLMFVEGNRWVFMEGTLRGLFSAQTTDQVLMNYEKV